MNDRDFKLLVREYFQAKSKVLFNPIQDVEPFIERRDELEKKILKELEEFTRKDVEELPFRSEEDILP